MAKTKEQYEEHVLNVLLRKGYRFTDETSVATIVELWANQEEFDPDFTDREIVLMYEVLDIGTGAWVE